MADFCAHKKPTGQQCKARPMGAAVFCFFHNPAVAKERTAAQRRGQQSSVAPKKVVAEFKHVLPAEHLEVTFDLSGPAGVRALISDTITRLRKDEIEPPKANSIANLLNSAIKTLALEGPVAQLPQNSSLHVNLTVEDALRIVEAGQRNGVAARVDENH